MKKIFLSLILALATMTATAQVEVLSDIAEWINGLK